MKNTLLLLCTIFIFSCQNAPKKEVESNKSDSTCNTKKEFKMYEMSEMAALMEQMYAHNMQVKKHILNKEDVGDYPEYFEKIHTAKFTDESDNDAFFKQKAKEYIVSQKLIYTTNGNTKENFNKGVDVCISCHNQKCGGPIERIKKLYIK